MRQRRLFPALLILVAALAAPARGEDPTPSPGAPAAEQKQGSEENSDTPASPDGKFAFVVDYESEDARTIDLIDNRSKKVLRRIGSEEIGSTRYSVKWADDSSRFALMTRIGHPNQGLDIFFRDGNKFRKLDLPKLPDANIPAKMRHGKSFPHCSANDWTEAESWNKDGSLDVSVTTTIDGGDDGALSATRNFRLTFDKSGHAKLTRNTIKYETQR